MQPSSSDSEGFKVSNSELSNSVFIVVFNEFSGLAYKIMTLIRFCYRVQGVREDDIYTDVKDLAIGRPWLQCD